MDQMIPNMPMPHNIWQRSKASQRISQIPLGKDFTISLASSPDVMRYRHFWYHSTHRELGNRMRSNFCRIETIKPLRPRRNWFKQISFKSIANPVGGGTLAPGTVGNCPVCSMVIICMTGNNIGLFLF